MNIGLAAASLPWRWLFLVTQDATCAGYQLRCSLAPASYLSARGEKSLGQEMMTSEWLIVNRDTDLTRVGMVQLHRHEACGI